MSEQARPPSEIVERIRKLLRLAKNDGATEAEAANAAARVQEILFRYNLDLGSIDLDHEAVKPGVVLGIVTTDTVETDWRHVLLFELAGANFCFAAQAVHTPTVEVLGAHEDVQVVLDLHAYLETELQWLAHARFPDRPVERSEQYGATQYSTRVGSFSSTGGTLDAFTIYQALLSSECDPARQRQEFLTGAVAMIAQRLRAEKARLMAESNAATALVTTKEADVQNAVKDRYKNLIQEQSGPPSRISSAYIEGVETGRTVRLTAAAKELRDGAD